MTSPATSWWWPCARPGIVSWASTSSEEPEGREGRERHATLSTLLAIVSQLARDGDGQDRDAVAAALAERASRERADDADGVELLTLHRAKGLEWDAVFIPMLEEGSLPVSQAGDDETSLAEERRLLYVGITRARRHLTLSWAAAAHVSHREVAEAQAVAVPAGPRGRGGGHNGSCRRGSEHRQAGARRRAGAVGCR